MNRKTSRRRLPIEREESPRLSCTKKPRPARDPSGATFAGFHGRLWVTPIHGGRTGRSTAMK